MHSAYYADEELLFASTLAEEPCSLDRRHDAERFLQVFIHPIICLMGFVGNSLVIVTYALYKRTRSMTDVCLLNVAVSDVMFAVALPLIIYNERHEWRMGGGWCKLLRGVYSVNLYSGMLLLACVSADRYLAIARARRSLRLRCRTPPYSRLMCAAVWSLALILSLPTFVFHERYRPVPSESVLLDNGTQAGDVPYMCLFSFHSNETARAMKTAVPSAQVVFGFLLPLLVMGFCYTRVTVTLLRTRNFQRHKAVRVVLAVVLVFVGCHAPYNVALLYYTVNMFAEQDCGHEEAVEMTITITKSLAYVHSCLNPLLYAFIGVNFRNHFLKILQDLRCWSRNYTSPRRTFSTRRSVDSSRHDCDTSFTM